MRGAVLALDLATVTGWACGAPDARPVHGSVVLRGQDRCARYAALMDWLWDAQKVHGFVRVVAEAPGNYRSRDALIQAIGLAEHAAFWCWDRSIPFRLEPSATSRKAVIGRGTFPIGAAKDAVAQWCRGEGYTPGDDNAADAILIWHHATGYRAQREMAA